MAKAPARARKSGTANSAVKGKRARASYKGGATKKATPSKTRRAAPKVMGVTIPKTLTDALNTLINSPRGREILASAIVAAASAAARRRQRRATQLRTQVIRLPR